jgi:hypothetical protein
MVPTWAMILPRVNFLCGVHFVGWVKGTIWFCGFCPSHQVLNMFFKFPIGPHFVPYALPNIVLSETM